MQLAEHELHDLNELTMSCVNSITNMAHFMSITKDQELKAMLERHFPLHIQDYNMKVEFIKNSQGATQTLQVPELPRTLTSFTQSTVPPQNITPRTNVQQFNDREIATAYLLTLKRAGREYAWSAMEASNPTVRSFLEDAFRMSSHHAYDVWQWMVKKGFYPLQPASPQVLNMTGQMYDVVQATTPMMQ